MTQITSIRLTPTLTEKEKSRFESKIQITPGCWIWQGYLNKGGYGGFKHGRKLLGPHRVSYQLYVGPITDGLKIRHKCDNPSCVNPDHLELGTSSDNTKDVLNRGRFAVGSSHGNAIYTDNEVLLLKLRLKNGESCSSIAAGDSAKYKFVHSLKQGTRWKHIEV